MASAAAVSFRSTAPWFPRAIRKTRGTSQWPSVGRAAAPPFALRGPRRHGHKPSQLQFSRYSPSIRHASGIVVSYPRPRGAGSVRGRDCRCAPARVSTASVTVLASSRDGPHPRRALPDDRAAAGARGARRGRARARGGLVSGRRARPRARPGRRRARGERPVPVAPRRAPDGDRVEGPHRRPPPRRPRRLPRWARGPRRRAPAQHHARQPYRRLWRGRVDPLPAPRDRRGGRAPGRPPLAGPPGGAGARARDTAAPGPMLSGGEGRGSRRRLPQRPARGRGARRSGTGPGPRLGRARRRRAPQRPRGPRGRPRARGLHDGAARGRRPAEVIAAPHGLTPTVIPALREMAMGRWDGRTAEEIRGSEPAAFADWMARVGEFPFPEGESVPDLRARAWPAFEAIIGAHAGESVAIVAHGGTNRALLCTALGLELRRLLALGQDYGALSVRARGAAGWRLVRLSELPMLSCALRVRLFEERVRAEVGPREGTTCHHIETPTVRSSWGPGAPSPPRTRSRRWRGSRCCSPGATRSTRRSPSPPPSTSSSRSCRASAGSA